MEKTWKPTTAGILSIVAGSLNILVGIAVSVAGLVVFPWYYSSEWYNGGWWTGAIDTGPLILAFGSVLIVFGIVTLIGGIFALKRRVWGLALAGAICALFPPPIIVLGILSIIFLALAKREFI